MQANNNPNPRNNTSYSNYLQTLQTVLPVQWHEGMLLSPQHLQQSDVYYQHYIVSQLYNLSPYYWGVHNLTVDENHLSNGLLRITQLQATMPDGTCIRYDGQLDSPLELDLKALIAEQQKSHVQSALDKGGTKSPDLTSKLTIYIGISSYKANGSNLEGELARFESVEDPQVCDHNSGDNPISIPKLKPRCYLLPESKVSAQYSAMPLLQINPQEHNRFVASFIPPMTQVKVNSYLGEACNQICSLLKRKAGYLSEQISARNQNEISMHLQHHFALLISALPQLEALTINGTCHPLQLYYALAHLLGSLNAAKPEIALMVLPRYLHDRLNQTFDSLLQRIHYLLDHIQDNFIKIPFAVDQRVFKLLLRPEWLRSKLYVGVYLNTVNYSDACEWLENAVIASDYAVSLSKDRRIVGASRVIDPQQPEVPLTSSPNILLCEINCDPMFIRAGHELNIFNISEHRHRCPTDIVLYTPTA